MFISFLGLLRTKYLAAMDEQDLTFHSVVLAGLHDVKNLKTKIRQGGEQKLGAHDEAQVQVVYFARVLVFNSLLEQGFHFRQYFSNFPVAQALLQDGRLRVDDGGLGTCFFEEAKCFFEVYDGP